MIKSDVKHEQATAVTYTIGFAYSVILTVLAFAFVNKSLLSGWALLGFLGFLAVLQLLVQLLFFLHLGDEKRPRWNLVSLLFAVMVIVIIVFGSMWIMKNLNYDHGHNRSVPANKADSEIIKDEGYNR